MTDTMTMNGVPETVTAEDFWIKSESLKALSLVMSSDVGREYICGVRLEQNGIGLVGVATDGHRMLKMAVVGDGQLPQGITIPADAVEEILKVAPKGQLLRVWKSDQWRITTISGIDRRFQPIASDYPNWQQVWPKEWAECSRIGFNPDYLDDARKIGKILGHTTLELRFSSANGTGGVEITIGPAKMLLMPQRLAN